MEKTHAEKINELIPVASAIADKRVEVLDDAYKSIKGVDGTLYNYSFHTKFFHQEMNRLAFNAGLRSY